MILPASGLSSACLSMGNSDVRHTLIRAATAALLFAAAPAHAACTGPLVTAGTLAFGVYDAAVAAATNANGSVTISCGLVLESLPSLTVALSSGSRGAFGPRAMSAGGDMLLYDLYTSPAFTTVWGDGTSGTSTQVYNSGSRAVTFTVYGKVPAHQFVSPGPYTDTITVTVTY